MTPAELNRSWASEIVQGVLNAGVGHFFLSPGARSAPLVEQLDRLPRGWVTTHYDERGMGFAAVGWARANRTPVACITTSGTAVANLLPSAVEALHSNLPIVYLTADRPPALRGSGANQTINQAGIFGMQVKGAMDLPVASESFLPDIGALVCDAVRFCRDGFPGPVHLNVPFGEPLLPEHLPPLSPLAFPNEPAPSGVSVNSEVLQAVEDFDGVERGLIVVGELDLCEQRAAESLVRLAGRLGWPVFADALSGLKGSGDAVINCADYLLLLRGAPVPDRVLHFGGRIVSRRVQEFLSRLPGSKILQVRKFPEVVDPAGQNPSVVHAEPSIFADLLNERVASFGVPDLRWLESWTSAAGRVSELDLFSKNGEFLTEPNVVRLAGALTRELGGLLFLGNSMPVRDFDIFASGEAKGVPVLGNRGASGIDGNIATIAGIAAGTRKRVFAVLGDLTFLHDVNSLSLVRGLPVVIFVINNRGGGIFRFLPLNFREETKAAYLETPHHFSFAHAASLFGLQYLLTDSAEEIRDLVCRHRDFPLVVEVPSERATNHEIHKAITSTLTQWSFSECHE